MDSIVIGASATPSAPLNWLRDRGVQAAGFGTDGMSDAQGVMYADVLDGFSSVTLAFVGDTITWDGENLVVERA